MSIGKGVRNCLGIFIFATAFVVFASGISFAEEVVASVPVKPADETASGQFQPPPATSEALRVSPNGGYYKIDATNYAYYEKPEIYSFLVNAPLNIVDWLKDSFQEKNALPIVGLLAVTAGLIVVDQDLIRGAKSVGKSLNISGSDGKLGRAWSGSPIQYPTDFGTTLYYLGDGMIPISITVGMLGYGLITSDVRSLQTSSQLAEGFLSVAIVTQTIKRITGRESPSEATQSGGKWRLFPSFSEFGSNTPKYDAMPSGHVATSMMTITILADNYPEYPLIRPIGYTLMGLLGFQMMNNSVHWASDYPIAIAIGYGLGKVAVSHGRKVVTTGDALEKTSSRPLFTDVAILPMPMGNGGAVFVTARF